MWPNAPARANEPHDDAYPTPAPCRQQESHDSAIFIEKPTDLAIQAIAHFLNCSKRDVFFALLQPIQSRLIDSQFASEISLGDLPTKFPQSLC